MGPLESVFDSEKPGLATISSAGHKNVKVTYLKLDLQRPCYCCSHERPKKVAPAEEGTLSDCDFPTAVNSQRGSRLL